MAAAPNAACCHNIWGLWITHGFLWSWSTKAPLLFFNYKCLSYIFPFHHADVLKHHGSIGAGVLWEGMLWLKLQERALIFTQGLFTSTPDLGQWQLKSKPAPSPQSQQAACLHTWAEDSMVQCSDCANPVVCFEDDVFPIALHLVAAQIPSAGWQS